MKLVTKIKKSLNVSVPPLPPPYPDSDQTFPPSYYQATPPPQYDCEWSPPVYEAYNRIMNNQLTVPNRNNRSNNNNTDESRFWEITDTIMFIGIFTILIVCLISVSYLLTYN